MDTAHNFFLLNCSRTNIDFEKDKNKTKTKQINKQILTHYRTKLIYLKINVSVINMHISDDRKFDIFKTTFL